MKKIILFLMVCISLEARYYSQLGQDKYVNEHFFKNKKNGVFVDIGAYNGVITSNSCFFEKELGWTGICIEPTPDVFLKLKQNRCCICVEGCIAPEDKIVQFVVVDHVKTLSGIKDNYTSEYLQKFEQQFLKGTHEIMVKAYNINGLLERNNISHIDFLSLDTEGGELEILKSWNFERFPVDVITVENNFHDKGFKEFLLTKRYEMVAILDVDEVYVKIK